ncbi:hypothetical protein Tco_0664414 [Tanacetum coccineum]
MVIIIKSDIRYDYFPAQTTSDEGSDHNPFQATSDESSDHNPFQVTSNESSDHNPFQVTSNESSDDTLKSSSEDTCSSDYTKKPTIPSEIVQWYDDLCSDDQRTIYKVPTKRPPPMMNCVLGLAANTTWQRILNKEFGIISSKEDVGESSNVRSKGKRKMM